MKPKEHFFVISVKILIGKSPIFYQPFVQLSILTNITIFVFLIMISLLPRLCRLFLDLRKVPLGEIFDYWRIPTELFQTHNNITASHHIIKDNIEQNISRQSVFSFFFFLLWQSTFTIFTSPQVAVVAEAWSEAPISYFSAMPLKNFSAMPLKKDEATSLLPDHHQSTASQTH